MKEVQTAYSMLVTHSKVGVVKYNIDGRSTSHTVGNDEWKRKKVLEVQCFVLDSKVSLWVPSASRHIAHAT